MPSLLFSRSPLPEPKIINLPTSSQNHSTTAATNTTTNPTADAAAQTNSRVSGGGEDPNIATTMYTTTTNDGGDGGTMATRMPFSSCNRSGNKLLCANSNADLKDSYVWDNVPVLNWTLHSQPKEFSESDVRDTLAQAFAVWSVYLNKKITWVTPASKSAQINISFVPRVHNTTSGLECAPFDGVGKSLAHALYPPIGDIHFDIEERWTLTGRSTRDVVNFYVCALHEIGHALGLDHSPYRDSIMYERLQNSFNNNSIITYRDVDALENLYGKRARDPKTLDKLAALRHWQMLQANANQVHVQAITENLFTKASTPNSYTVFVDDFMYNIENGGLVMAQRLQQKFKDFVGSLKMAFVYNRHYYLVNTDGYYWVYRAPADSLIFKTLKSLKSRSGYPRHVQKSFSELRHLPQIPEQMFLWRSRSQKKPSLFYTTDNHTYHCYANPDIKGELTDWIEPNNLGPMRISKIVSDREDTLHFIDNTKDVTITVSPSPTGYNTNIANNNTKWLAIKANYNLLRHIGGD